RFHRRIRVLQGRRVKYDGRQGKPDCLLLRRRQVPVACQRRRPLALTRPNVRCVSRLRFAGTTRHVTLVRGVPVSWASRGTPGPPEGKPVTPDSGATLERPLNALATPSYGRDSGLVYTPGRRVVGAKGENPFVCPSRTDRLAAIAPAIQSRAAA